MLKSKSKMVKFSSGLPWKQGYTSTHPAAVKGSAESAEYFWNQARLKAESRKNFPMKIRKKGYRLACLSHVKSDIVVRIPVESEVDAGVLNINTTPRHTARVKDFSIKDLKEKGLILPPVEKKISKINRTVSTG